MHSHPSGRPPAYPHPPRPPRVVPTMPSYGAQPSKFRTFTNTSADSGFRDGSDKDISDIDSESIPDHLKSRHGQGPHQRHLYPPPPPRPQVNRHQLFQIRDNNNSPQRDNTYSGRDNTYSGRKLAPIQDNSIYMPHHGTMPSHSNQPNHGNLSNHSSPASQTSYQDNRNPSSLRIPNRHPSDRTPQKRQAESSFINDLNLRKNDYVLNDPEATLSMSSDVVV